MRIIQLAVAATFLALCGCRDEPSDPKASVEEAWVQLPAVRGRPGAAYFTLESDRQPTRLIGVSSPRAGRVELHGTAMEKGVARMRPLENPSFSDGKLAFAPGGNHAMMFDLDPGLKPGDKIPLTFTFDPLPPVTVEAEVRAFGGGHEGH